MTAPFNALLIANRGEIAIRIARACADLGIRSVAVFAEDDAASLHVRKADVALPLAGRGVAAYLDMDRLVALALEQASARASTSSGRKRKCSTCSATRLPRAPWPSAWSASSPSCQAEAQPSGPCTSMKEPSASRSNARPGGASSSGRMLSSAFSTEPRLT